MSMRIRWACCWRRLLTPLGSRGFADSGAQAQIGGLDRTLLPLPDTPIGGRAGLTIKELADAAHRTDPAAGGRAEHRDRVARRRRFRRGGNIRWSSADAHDRCARGRGAPLQ